MMRYLSRIEWFIIISGILVLILPNSRMGLSIVENIGLSPIWSSLILLFFGCVILVSPALVKLFAGGISSPGILSKTEYKRIDTFKNELIDKIGSGDSVESVSLEVSKKADVPPEKVIMWLNIFYKTIVEDKFLSEQSIFIPFIEKYGVHANKSS